MNSEPLVHLVDDESAIRESIRWLVESAGLRVQTHATAGEFLEAYDPSQPGCLVLDLRLPGMDGLELQDRLLERELAIPVIFISGHADVPMAVRAMKRGAFDLLEKPFNDQLLLDRIQAAIQKDLKTRTRQKRVSDSSKRLARLSPREYEVMELVVAGKQNKTIAAELGVSPKTVEAHRSNVMDKMQADSLADLVRMVLATGDVGEGKPPERHLSPNARQYRRNRSAAPRP